VLAWFKFILVQGGADTKQKQRQNLITKQEFIVAYIAHWDLRQYILATLKKKYMFPTIEHIILYTVRIEQLFII
jgi:hypothetical protein